MTERNERRLLKKLKAKGIDPNSITYQNRGLSREKEVRQQRKDRKT
jgi:hypothetical protein